MAIQVNYTLAAAAKEDSLALAVVLRNDDFLELALRRLSSHVYYSRAKDRTGATHMLGVVPPGTATDLAPSWLVSDVTVFSKTEHQRDERVAAAASIRQRYAQGPGKGDKDKGRGRGRGDKGDKGGGRRRGAGAQPSG